MTAIVTVTNEKYISGTEVLLYSLLKNHKNYKGDLIVIHHELPQRLRRRLVNRFNVKLESVSNELLKKLNGLLKAYPNLASKKERFWSLELFRLRQYEKVLFMDSDILCKGSLNHVLALEDKFSAVVDLSFYKGKGRDRNTFEYSSFEKKGAFQKIFNAGLMMVHLQKLEKRVYIDLLNLLQPEYFNKITSGHTDQYVLNRYFENKVNWLNPEYNYIVRAEDLISNQTNIKLENAKALHYIRYPKPWNFRKLLKNKLKGKKEEFSFKEWHQTYLEVLKSGNSKKIEYYIMSVLIKLL